MRNCYKVTFEYEDRPDEFRVTSYVMEYAEDAIHFANWVAYSKEFKESGIEMPDSVYVFPMRSERLSFTDMNGDRHDVTPLFQDEDDERFVARYSDVKKNLRYEYGERA